MLDTSRELQVLVVDDNPADVRLVAEAFDECQYPHHLYTAKDGLDAIAFVTKLKPFERVPRPDLIIVDLNMPGIDGYGVLAAIKRTEEFHAIPVIMFSTSDDPADVKKAYDLHANCYIVKPLDFQGFVGAICSLATFWAHTATLPQPLKTQTS
jgi:CheY-like chemotaxis protein